ncbi:MAG: hypothetical protein ISP90_16615 [Nevskia sp.]|nr:hypothetical protein [Nevskia sp.]
MNDLIRRNHYDVTGRVFVADPRTVCAGVVRILAQLHPRTGLEPVRRAFALFSRLYAGELPGYRGCETRYHDVQHSLDCALAFARLADGHDRSVAAGERLGGRHVALGVIAALFHDAGYIRKDGDRVGHGAELTLVHVRRSGEFLASVLPGLGFADEAPVVERLVHYTGYEMALDAIRLPTRRDHRLGFLLGSADMLAQMADRCYLEKCRDFLYEEFELCGLAGAPRDDGPRPLYGSPEELLGKTREFRDRLWAERMDGRFEGVYRHAADHFGGANPYLEAIEGHLRRLREMPAGSRLGDGLRRRAESIGAGTLRSILTQRPPPAPADLRRRNHHPRRGRNAAPSIASTTKGVVPCA